MYALGRREVSKKGGKGLHQRPKRRRSQRHFLGGWGPVQNVCVRVLVPEIPSGGPNFHSLFFLPAYVSH